MENDNRKDAKNYKTRQFIFSKKIRKIVSKSKIALGEGRGRAWHETRELSVSLKERHSLTKLTAV
jgi:hypothetical protein